MICLCIFTSMLIAVQNVEPSPERDWRTPDELNNQLKKNAQSFDEVNVSTIGFTANGKPILCLEVARDGELAKEDRSAILVVAGIDGNLLLGTEVAVDLIDVLLAMDPETTMDLLEKHKLFIIPQVNVDVATEYFKPVKIERRKNYKPVDDDFDGFIDEDSPEDINGDGLITMMRVRDKEKATHLPDPDNPRLHITPDALKGQSAEFVLYTEGIDNDNDGKYNEDSEGGVDLNKNFMHGYKYHGDGAGSWQLSESESKALIDFVLAHQEIAFILVYGQHDTLTKPLQETGKGDAGAPKTIDEGDVELYKQISDRFNDFTSLNNTEQPNLDGSFVAWAYAQYGVPAFSTPLWSIPESSDEQSEEMRSNEDPSPDKNVNSEEETEKNSHETLTPSGVGDISQQTLDELLQAAKDAGYIDEDETNSDITAEEVEMYCKMMGIEVRRVTGNAGTKKSSSSDAAWLRYSDNQRNGDGFVEWSVFEHPQLGEVEIGGWVPYFKNVPPTDVIENRVVEQANFIIDIAGKLPDVRLGDARIKQLGKSLWEVKIPVINDGWLPSGTTMAKRNKRVRPYVIRVNVPNETILSGQKVQRIWSLEGGGTQKWFTWIINANPRSTISITLYSEKFGSTSTVVTMKSTNGGKK